MLEGVTVESKYFDFEGSQRGTNLSHFFVSPATSYRHNSCHIQNNCKGPQNEWSSLGNYQNCLECPEVQINSAYLYN